MTCYRKASLLEVRLRSDAMPGKGRSAPRGEITEFTPAARRRMLQMMAKIEQAAVPLFVTLTYPDDFPLYREDYKGHLEAFCDRMERRWRGMAVIWKLEFKERKSGKNAGKVAPHCHLFVYGVLWAFPAKTERGRYYTVELTEKPGEMAMWYEKGEASDGSWGCGWYVSDTESAGFVDGNGDVWGADSFRRWVSRNWFDVVGSNQVRHFQAGTRVEKLKTVQGAFAYAAKRYLAKQEDMPEMEHKPGRFWGVIGRKNLPFGKKENRDVSAKEPVQLRRIMRRYRWANTPPEKRKFLRKSQLWSQEFTAKLFCNVEFWIERLPKLIGFCDASAILIQNAGQTTQQKGDTLAGSPPPSNQGNGQKGKVRGGRAKKTIRANGATV
jgi:hypothetical protein